MKKSSLLLILSLYITSSLVSFGLFSYLGVKAGNAAVVVGDVPQEDNGTLLSQLLEINPNEKKDQACPLTGKYYTNHFRVFA